MNDQNRLRGPSKHTQGIWLKGMYKKKCIWTSMKGLCAGWAGPWLCTDHLHCSHDCVLQSAPVLDPNQTVRAGSGLGNVINVVKLGRCSTSELQLNAIPAVCIGAQLQSAVWESFKATLVTVFAVKLGDVDALSIALGRIYTCGRT